VGAITGSKEMAKTSPGEFIRQVRAEIGKVVWPTRQETTQTAIMVLIMTIILAVFFLGVDAFFNMVVQGPVEPRKIMRANVQAEKSITWHAGTSSTLIRV
jgi:preprotein translocase subunit SecE